MKIKATLTLIAATLTMCGCSIYSDNREETERNLQLLMKNRPHTQLQDIYKSCFQNHFGVAHMLADSITVLRYIEQETEKAQQSDTLYYEPCGLKDYGSTEYFRINLSAVRNGKLSAAELTSAFIESAAYSRTQVTEEWIEEWNRIQKIVREKYPNLNGFTKDSTIIAEKLKQGEYVIHHSKEYSNRYRPHYRIIHHSVFKKNLLPKLK